MAQHGIEGIPESEGDCRSALFPPDTDSCTIFRAR